MGSGARGWDGGRLIGNEGALFCNNCMYEPTRNGRNEALSARYFFIMVHSKANIIFKDKSCH